MRKMIGLAMMALAVCGMAEPTTVCLPGRAFHEITRRRHTGIPSIAVSPKSGRLWVTFYCGGTRGEDRNSYVPLLTSGDGGRTWKEVLYADPDESGPRRAFDPQVWVAPDGRLRWSWTDALCDTSKDDYSRDYGGNEGIRSTHVLKMATLDADAEPTAAPSTVDVGRGVMMGKPIVLDSGEWLFPSAHWDDDPSGCFYVTTDGGRTFTPRGGVTIPKGGRGVDEHYVVQRTNGDLVTYLRGAWETKDRRTNPWTSESKDRGATWTPAVPAPFAHTSSRACVIRLASGAWLLVKHGNFNESNGRRNLKAFLSRDEGRTWTGGLPIAGGLEWISYPDACQKPDGTIVVVYDYRRLGDQEISYDEFTEEDVSAGRPVSGRCRFRNVILRKHQLTGAKTPTATESEAIVRSAQANQREK